MIAVKGKKVMVTGSCGFIGVCLALRLLRQGFHVIGLDDLSRPGSHYNLEELQAAEGSFTFHQINLSRTAEVFALFPTIGEVDALFHLAGQVAVTTSYVDREKDFFNNAVASFNVIEAAKRFTPGAYCLYASTNKVYGDVDSTDPIGCDFPLKPYTPYGVSKAAAELYFTEYGREEMGLSTCCLRQSCIYGHHQYGVEDQGWIAWFSIANILGLPITIYGDGLQVRDILFIDDLLDLYQECYERRVTGVYPLGGGLANKINLRQALDLITRLTGQPFASVLHGPRRPGDQPYFVADTSWTGRLGLAWKPQTDLNQGVAAMIDWIQANREKVERLLVVTGRG